MPEGTSAPEIKISNNPQIQKRVEETKSAILEKHPTAEEALVNDQVRSRIAAEIKIERLRKEVERNKGKAIRDQLTGALNGTGFEEIMQLEGRKTLRKGKSMVIVVLDANDLKEINKEGHAKGDLYLKSIADVLSKTSRASDTLGRKSNSEIPESEDQKRVARWGGDEFGVILEETDIEGGKAWWQRTAREFEASGITIGAGMQVLYPEELVGLTPGEISVKISDKKHEADIAMMGKAKPDSKTTNKPVLTVYNELSNQEKVNLTQQVEGLVKT